MSEAMKELMDRMRSANSASKTARARVKTASHEDLTGRGDLLARTIHDITSKEEERIFPDEVKARKEAAERESLAASATTSAAQESAAADDVPPSTPTAAAQQPAKEASETTEPGATKEAAEDALLADFDTLLANPLVKHGYDSVMAEHKDEVDRLAAVIMAK